MKKTQYPFQISYKNFLIMRLVSKGDTSLQISKKLGLSQIAVKYQIVLLRKKFNCKNITHLTSTLLRQHLIN
jgi:DNA-binding CsgD family transcriptional regulator